MRGFFGADCAAISTLLMPYDLVAWNPQQGDFTGDRLEGGEECENSIITERVEYGSATAWTEERESAMITMKGDRGSGPERIVSRQ